MRLLICLGISSLRRHLGRGIVRVGRVAYQLTNEIHFYVCLFLSPHIRLNLLFIRFLTLRNMAHLQLEVRLVSGFFTLTLGERFLE